MAEQKVTISVDTDVNNKPLTYSQKKVLLTWLLFTAALTCAFLGIRSTDGLFILLGILPVTFSIYLWPGYIRRNVVGYYAYINMSKSNGGDRLKCRVELEPALWRDCIIRLPISGWFRHASVIKTPCATANNTWRVKVLGDLWPLCYNGLQLTDCNKRTITSHDPEVTYHILSHSNVWRAMESLKNSQRQEREAVGGWLQLYQTLQKSQDAMCSPYAQFVAAYAKAVLVRRFGSRADLRELASIDYPDETASWSIVVDEHGYLLSARGRREHEAAKAAEAEARRTS